MSVDHDESSISHAESNSVQLQEAGTTDAYLTRSNLAERNEPRVFKHSCALCASSFEDATALATHRRREHVVRAKLTLGDFEISVPLLSGFFQCPITSCRSKCNHISALSRHMKTQHDVRGVAAEYQTEDNIPEKKRKLSSPNFDFGNGSRLALACDRKSAFHHTMAIGCTPVALHMNHQSMPSSLTIHPLIRQDALLDVVNRIPFADDCRSEQFECVLQLHKENGHSVKPSGYPYTGNNHVYLEKSIEMSRFPKLLDTITFVEASTAVIEALNTDFRLCPPLLHAVATLHAGCIIADGVNTVFVLTAETYARAKSVDAHGETNLKSMPVPGTVYQKLSIGIHEEADGGATKKKLKIGSTTANVLVTMSTLITKNEVTIGPETNIELHGPSARIYFDELKVNHFLDVVRRQPTDYRCPEHISNLRQLISGFDSPSTYAPWRATLDALDTDLLQPATVFTIVDTPSNLEYGHGSKSTVKVASYLLQKAAIAVLTATSIVYDDIQDINSETDEVIVAFLTELKSCRQIDPMKASRHLLPISRLAAQGLAKANARIKRNVEERLSVLYGEYS